MDRQQGRNITPETGENRYVDGWIDNKGVILHQKQEKTGIQMDGQIARA